MEKLQRNNAKRAGRVALIEAYETCLDLVVFNLERIN